MKRLLSVLLVDDNHHDLELASIAFDEYAQSAQLTTFTDGRSALAHLRTPDLSLPDVIVLDLHMPGMSGLEVLEAIRADPLLQYLPVVILSTSDDAGDIRRAYQLFANSYMVKQPEFTLFVAQIDHFVAYWQGCQLPPPSV